MDVESRLSGAEEVAWKQIAVLQTEMASTAQHESEVRHLRATGTNISYTQDEVLAKKEYRKRFIYL